MEVGGQILWIVTPFCETLQIYHLMGGRPMKGVLGNHSRDRSFHLVHWLSIPLLLLRFSQESINLERNSYLDCSSDTLFTREEFGRVTYWSQTLRSWRQWTHRKSTRKDSMRKRWFSHQNKRDYFPISDPRNKLLGGDQDLRTSTLIWHRPIQGESNINFLGESEGSLPQPHDSFPDAGEAMNDFWSISGSFIYRHRWTTSQTSLAERRIIPYSTERHWRIQNYSYEFGCQAREAHWLLERRWIKDLSDPWTGLSHFCKKKPPEGYMWSRWEINEKTADIQARSFMARNLEVNGKARQAEGKAEVV